MKARFMGYIVYGICPHAGAGMQLPIFQARHHSPISSHFQAPPLTPTATVPDSLRILPLKLRPPPPVGLFSPFERRLVPFGIHPSPLLPPRHSPQLPAQSFSHPFSYLVSRLFRVMSPYLVRKSSCLSGTTLPFAPRTTYVPP